MIPPDIFLSSHPQEAQLLAQARERDFDILVKKQEREMRIQQQFQQEQADRRTENMRGKSFIDKGSGVNPFFVMQRERVAASCSARGDGAAAAESSYTAASAITAEMALYEFLVST